MRYLLDTNVISEPFKRAPEIEVVRGLGDRSVIDLGISVLTLGELTMCLELLTTGPRHDELEHWISHELPRRFVGCLFPIDDAIARA